MTDYPYDEDAVERVVALIEGGMSVAGAILAVVEADEATVADLRPIVTSVTVDPAQDTVS